MCWMKECMGLLIHIKNQMYSWQMKSAERERLITVSLMAQKVKNPSVMQETWVQSLGGEVSLEKGMDIHSNILAWRVPWTEAVHGSCKESDTTERLTLWTYITILLIIFWLFCDSFILFLLLSNIVWISRNIIYQHWIMKT